MASTPSVTMTFRAEDEGLEQELDEVQGQINTFALNAASAAQVIETLEKIFSALKDTVVDLLDTFGEQEEQMVLTAHLMEITGRTATMAAEDLFELAAAYQATSTFGDEATLAASRYLLIMENITNDVLPDAIRASQDLAAALGRDLVGSAQMVGRALEDPARGMTMLLRIGVTFTEQQKEVIKLFQETGREAEATQMVLDVLNSKFGGSAEAMVGTYRGQVQQLQNTFGDLKEEVGEVIAAGLDPLLEELRNNDELINDVVSALDDMIPAAREWGVVLRDVTKATTELYNIWKEFKESDIGAFIMQVNDATSPTGTIRRALTAGAPDMRTRDLRAARARMDRDAESEVRERERQIEIAAARQEQADEKLAKERQKEAEREAERRLKAIEKEASAMARLADKWRASVRTPFEELIRQVREVNMLAERGDLGPRERIRILEDLRKEFLLEGDIVGARQNSLDRMKSARENIADLNERLNEDKGFQSRIESLTGLSRRISSAAASDTPEDKTREAIEEQKKVQTKELKDANTTLNNIEKVMRERLGMTVAVFGRRN